uniref:Uncharacterized protein n=1 Tax=Panagrolaimus superbus TaxID=310955 RepID=A0A914YNS3_9BILA
MKLRNGKDLKPLGIRPLKLKKKEKRMYSFKTPYQQRFSLPLPTMRYIINRLINSEKSPDGWLKLIKCAKWFFSKNPILPVQFADYENGTWLASEFRSNNYLKEFEISNENSTKLWIYDGLSLYRTPYKHTLSTFLPVVYRCNLSMLFLSDQDISINEYKFLTSTGSCREIEFQTVAVKNSDGSLVTIDKLLENCDDLETFTMSFRNDSATMFSPAAIKKLVQHLSAFNSLHKFELYEIPETFDVRLLVDLFKKDATTAFRFYFEENISNHCKEILENFIKEVIENPPQNVPMIDFEGQDEENYGALTELHYPSIDESDFLM